MTVRMIASAFLTMVLVAAPAAAQTVTTPPPSPQPVLTTPTTTSTPTTTTLSAFDKLSPGNRMIARALFDAQQTQATSTGTGTTGTTTTTSKTLTLDQIAAMKQSGQGWGKVFKQMKAQGLVTEKNLGQVVSKHARQDHGASGQTTTAGNRTTDLGSDVHRSSRMGGDQDHVGRGAGHGGDRSSQAAVSHGNGSGNGSWSGGGGNSGHGGGIGRGR